MSAETWGYLLALALLVPGMAVWICWDRPDDGHDRATCDDCKELEK